MNKKEKYAALGFLAVLTLGLLFFSLNRYNFYHEYINIEKKAHKNNRYIPRSETQPTDSENRGETYGEQDENNLKIDINSAELSTLTKLPGIGRETALNIIEYRGREGAFSEIGDLLHVKGIGEKKLEMLKEYVTIK